MKKCKHYDQYKESTPKTPDMSGFIYDFVWFVDMWVAAMTQKISMQ
jgi:hypothetical protein